MLTQPEHQVAGRRLTMEDEKSSRMYSLTEWARNNYGRHISLRVARKYLEDDTYFWAALKFGPDRTGSRRQPRRHSGNGCETTSSLKGSG